MIFYIGSQEWELKFVTQEEMNQEWESEFESFIDGEFLLGLTIATTSTILINKDFPRRMSNVFNHELMHVCIASYHLSKSDDTNKKCYTESIENYIKHYYFTYFVNGFLRLNKI